MGVILREKKNKTGTFSLYLDISYKGVRYAEFLNIVLNGDKEQDPKRRALAKKIRAIRELEIISGMNGITPDIIKDSDFFSYLKNYERLSYYKNFKFMIADLKKFTGKEILPCSFITPSLVDKFKNHLKDSHNGSTPRDYFKCLKRMCKDLTREKLFRSNPCEGIVLKSTVGRELSKDVLFSDEIQILKNTFCADPEVKRACLFISQTGIRLCDLRLLRWENISNNQITFKQSKSYTNTVPLNKNAIKILGEIKKTGLIFSLPRSHTTINTYIDKWITASGIKKHITIHCLRHSFITNVGKNSNLYIAGKLAGHANVGMTDRYTHLIDNDRRTAVNSLPVFKNKK